MSAIHTFITVLLMCLGSSSSKKLPSYITLCRRSDPNLNQCVRNAVEQIRPFMADGVPELPLPPLNPLQLPEAGLDNGERFRASFKNIKIFYANEFQIETLKIDLKNFQIELGLLFPRLRLTSNYNIDGRILILQLQGHGPADGNLTNVRAKASVKGHLFDRKSQQYIGIDQMALDLDFGKPVFKFDNIFHDNEELNERTNAIINENIVDILDELRPVLYDTVTTFIVGIVKRVFNRHSFDELFPN